MELVNKINSTMQYAKEDEDKGNNSGNNTEITGGGSSGGSSQGGSTGGGSTGGEGIDGSDPVAPGVGGPDGPSTETEEDS